LKCIAIYNFWTKSKKSAAMMVTLNSLPIRILNKILSHRLSDYETRIISKLHHPCDPHQSSLLVDGQRRSSLKMRRTCEISTKSLQTYSCNTYFSLYVHLRPARSYTYELKKQLSQPLGVPIHIGLRTLVPGSSPCPLDSATPIS